MSRIIAVILILLILATPALAAPAGQAFVAYAYCSGSEVYWLAPTYTGAMSNTYVSVIMEAEQHGETYAVEVLYQYATTLANGRAVYRAIGWQPFSLNAERVTIVSGEIAEWGGAPLQDLLTGKEFVMGCWQVHMPLVVR